eukprot:scaffold3127_cov202-Prasinococcus_capsulatus_cf.AAC.4
MPPAGARSDGRPPDRLTVVEPLAAETGDLFSSSSSSSNSSSSSSSIVGLEAPQQHGCTPRRSVRPGLSRRPPPPPPAAAAAAAGAGAAGAGGGGGVAGPALSPPGAGPASPFRGECRRALLERVLRGPTACPRGWGDGLPAKALTVREHRTTAPESMGRLTHRRGAVADAPNPNLTLLEYHIMKTRAVLGYIY